MAPSQESVEVQLPLVLCGARREVRAQSFRRKVLRINDQSCGRSFDQTLPRCTTCFDLAFKQVGTPRLRVDEEVRLEAAVSEVQRALRDEVMGMKQWFEHDHLADKQEERSKVCGAHTVSGKSKRTWC